MTHKPTPDTIAEIAGKLTKGAKRACLSMTDAWAFPGKQTFEWGGAHALHWARVGLGRGALAENELQRPDPAKPIARGAYRLTPLGLHVKAHLEQSSQ